MFKENDIVLYGMEGVCVIGEIMERELHHQEMQYYVLRPVYRTGATIYVPVENESLVSRMKKVLSVQEIYQLIEDAVHEKMDWIDNDNQRKEEYKQILKDGDRKELMKLINVIYLKHEELKSMGKKIHANDEYVFKEAEKMLYEEFAYVLGIHKDEVVSFIVDRIKGEKNNV